MQRELGPLRGVVHAVMALDDAPMERLTEERMWTAMAPKALGAWHLHALTAELPLDFFVLFSSIAATVGNPGQANYVAGNAFLDALAYYRRARGLPALTINWGALGDVGHVARSPETAEKLERLGLPAMPLSDTLDALDELISSDAVQVAVAQVDWKALLRSTGGRIPARYAGLVGDARSEEGRAGATSGARDILDADDAELPSLLGGYIRDVVARAMRTSPTRIDSQQSLVNLGLDFADRNGHAEPDSRRPRPECPARQAHGEREPQHVCCVRRRATDREASWRTTQVADRRDGRCYQDDGGGERPASRRPRERRARHCARPRVRPRFRCPSGSGGCGS